jgi:hypothetical protein
MPIFMQFWLFVVLQMLAPNCTQIVNNEHFKSLMDFGALDDDKDVLEMVKCLGSHMAGGSRSCVCGNHSGKESSGSLLLGL